MRGCVSACVQGAVRAACVQRVVRWVLAAGRLQDARHTLCEVVSAASEAAGRARSWRGSGSARWYWRKDWSLQTRCSGVKPWEMLLLRGRAGA